VATDDFLAPPIDGVSLELYASVTARALKLGLTIEDTTALAVVEGVSPSRWDVASRAWRRLIVRDADIRDLYIAEYTRVRATT
jgi:hypothetical protein